MTEPSHPRSAHRDLFSLATAPLRELLDALTEAQTLAEQDAEVPARATQIARLIVADAVGLIRVGTRQALAEAGNALAQAVARPSGEQLRKRQPEAYRLLSAAAVTLGAAIAPSSSGGELAVLRSWEGDARRAVALVARSRGQAIRHVALRDLLGREEPYLLHMLAELEAADLIVRVQTEEEGEEAEVRLGPAAELPHVQELLPGEDDRSETEGQVNAQRVRAMFERLLRGDPSDSDLATVGTMLLRRELQTAERSLDVVDRELRVESADHSHVLCSVWISQTTLSEHLEQRGERPLMWRALIEQGEIIHVHSWSSPRHTHLGLAPGTLVGESPPYPDTAWNDDDASVYVHADLLASRPRRASYWKYPINHNIGGRPTRVWQPVAERRFAVSEDGVRIEDDNTSKLLRPAPGLGGLTQIMTLVSPLPSALEHGGALASLSASAESTIAPRDSD
jgi:hypothetical protein